MTDFTITLDSRQGVHPFNSYNNAFPLQHWPQLSHLRGFQVSLQKVSFLHTVYPFQNVNQLYFEDNGAPFTATIVRGNYTGVTMATHLAAILDAAGTLVHAVTYDTVNKRFTIDVGGGNTFRFVSGSQSAAHEMGYNTVGSVAQQISIGDYPVNLVGTRYVDIVTNLGTKNIVSGTNNNVLQRISINVSFGTIVEFHQQFDHFLQVSDSHIHLFEYILYDEYGNQYELPPNHHFEMTLKIRPGPRLF